MQAGSNRVYQERITRRKDQPVGDGINLKTRDKWLVIRIAERFVNIGNCFDKMPGVSFGYKFYSHGSEIAHTMTIDYCLTDV